MPAVSKPVMLNVRSSSISKSFASTSIKTDVSSRVVAVSDTGVGGSFIGATSIVTVASLLSSTPSFAL